MSPFLPPFKQTFLKDAFFPAHTHAGQAGAGLSGAEGAACVPLRLVPAPCESKKLEKSDVGGL